MRLNQAAVVTLTLSALCQLSPVHAQVTDAPAVSQPAKAEEATQVMQAAQEKAGKVRLAITLAGGGARGAAHIGVLRALEKAGIRPDFIAGNSSGAIIGSMYASGMTPDKIEETILSGKLKKAFFPKPMALQQALYVTRYAVQKLIGMKPRIGLYSGKSIAKFMDKTLPAGIENIEDTKIPLAITAINMVDTKPHWCSKGPIADAVRASCSVPLVYRPVEKDGMHLVDGGLRENMPTDMAQAAGAPVVLAVRLHRYLDVAEKDKFDSITEFVDRVTSILLAEIETKAIANADVVIEPKLPGMTMRSFKQADLREAIAEGEQATNKIIPKLQELLARQRMAERQQKIPL